MKTIAAFAVLFLAVFAACPGPQTVPTARRHVVDCAKEAIGHDAISLIPAVNSCLISALSGQAVGCLMGLINPAKAIGEDTIACLTRTAGSEFAAAAQENPGDEISNLGASNARAFFGERLIEFAATPEPGSGLSP